MFGAAPFYKWGIGSISPFGVFVPPFSFPSIFGSNLTDSLENIVFSVRYWISGIAKPMVCMRVAFHENDRNPENNENDGKQGVECWIGGDHGNHGNHENHGKPRVPQTTGLKISGNLWLNPARRTIGTEKTMTARDVTGLYAFFSAWKSSNFLHILGPLPY